jgi:hypothetical protein
MRELGHGQKVLLHEKVGVLAGARRFRRAFLTSSSATS